MVVIFFPLTRLFVCASYTVYSTVENEQFDWYTIQRQKQRGVNQFHQVEILVKNVFKDNRVH